MKKIKLTQGKVSLIDDEDFVRVSKYKWCFNFNGYAERRESKVLGGKIVRMHRFIMSAPKDKMVDHINMKGLDNRKANLRLCTKSENMCNRNKTRVNKSGYKGVSWDSVNNKWTAQIVVGGKNIKLGRYKSAREAGVVYNNAAIIHHGEFANLNKI